jgi:dipeptidase
MSYAIYIGKNHSAEGIAYLGGYGDEPSSHWLELVPRCEHAPDATITVGVTPQADLPGVLSQIPQITETARHIRTSYSYYKGVPAPLTNGGLNEYGVAVRDIWSTSRDELIEITPKNQSGPNYSDLARIVMERARSARHGVEIIGALIAQFGYSTYGGNSHLIADADEAWVVIECAGGVGLWAAERLGDDSIRASRPGYIEMIPVGDKDNPDFLYADNLVSFAIEQGWYRTDEVFNFNRVYGDAKGRWQGVAWVEAQMSERAKRPQNIGLEDVIWALRTSTLTGDTAGYGQIVPLHNPEHSALRYLWHTQVGALAAPFVPVYIGNHRIAEEYRKHRYLSAGESSRFMDMRHLEKEGLDSVSGVSQGIESTRSACRVFKRLMYLVLQNQDSFLAEVTAVWEALESALIEKNLSVLETAKILLQQQEFNLARETLDYFSNNELTKVLNLAEDLSRSIEARTRIQFGISEDIRHKSADQLW